MLGYECVRLMSLAERGLLATMRWYCWANDTIPSEPEALARVLGLDVPEVRAALSERVLGLFERSSDDPKRLHCPELSDQMKRLLERSASLAETGRRGGRATQRSRSADAQASATAHGQAGAEQAPKRTEKSRSERSRNEENCAYRESQGNPVRDEFVEEIEKAERAGLVPHGRVVPQ